MKILNIVLTSQNGGVEQVTSDYCQALSNLGHEVFAVVKNDAPYAEDILKYVKKVYKISNNFGYHDFFSIRNLEQILCDENIDLVISHAGRATVIARKAINKIKNKKVFLIAVNHSMNVKRSIGADLIFSINKPIFYRTLDLGQSVERSFVVPNAIDLSDIDFKGSTTSSSQIKISEKKTITLGVIGRFDRTKGFDLAICTIKILKNLSDKKFVLKIAGSGYYEPNLRSLVKELQLENDVEFIGWVKNKNDFFSAIDVFCLPSKSEPFGLVLLEAMKFAKPIISTDVDGPKEILRDGIDAVMVNFNSSKDVVLQIAEALLKISGDDEFANQLVKNSTNRLHEKFSFSSLEKKLSEIIGAGSLSTANSFLS